MKPTYLFENVYNITRFYLESAVEQDFYMAKYSDVAAANMEAKQHFEEYGKYELRSPNSLFEKSKSLCLYVDTDWYLKQNLDVAESGIDPIYHFQNYGRQEGRLPNSLVGFRNRVVEFFDGQWYLSRYIDVFRAGLDPRQHYVNYGAHESRFPSVFAEQNSLQTDENFLKFIAASYLQIYGSKIDYFEFLAWRGLSKLGFTRQEIISIIEFDAKSKHL